MGYLNGHMRVGPFKVWLTFAGLGAVANTAVAGLDASDFMERLRRIWPDAEIVPGLAPAGAIFAVLAAVLFLLVRTQVFVEVLQTASVAAALYAFYSFHPAVVGVAGGRAIFWIVTVMTLTGYALSQLPFVRLIRRSGTRSDRIGLTILLAASLVMILLPPIVLDLL